MRLSQWRAEAPTREAMSQKVLAVVVPVLKDLGASDDPDCWVYWGEDPAVRYSILVPTHRGLAQCHVRVNVPGEGPRASGKVVRWGRVQVGELAVEVTHGHRLVTSQLEGLVLKGVDDVADRIAAFVLAIYDAIDGRQISFETHARPVRRARPAAKRSPRQPIPLPAPKG
jgi:hypothetical protein